jgi:hypothetical protein
MKANESKAERLLRGKDAALDDKDMAILLDAFYEDSDDRHDVVAVAQRRGFRDGYKLGMIAGTEQLIRRIGHYKVVDEGDTLLSEFVQKHPSLVEDLRIAADKLNKARPILAGALKSYADELCKFDGWMRKRLCKFDGGQDNG